MSLIRQFPYFLLALLLTGIMINCSKDTTEPQQTPPSLPPAAAFLMEFDSFPLPDGGVLPEYPLLKGENWTWAATNVLVWNTVLIVNLVVPVTAFQAAFQHQPVKLDDGSWAWNYSFMALGVQHTASLRLSLNNNLAYWKMYISKQDQYTDFLWFEGEGDLGYSHGIWTVNMNPAAPVPYLEIEWNRDPQTETGDIKYTNVYPEDPNNGSYIKYGTMTSDYYDAFYTIFHKNAMNATEIEWNRETKIGRVHDVDYFQNEDWHCWDELQEDVECPF